MQPQVSANDVFLVQGQMADERGQAAGSVVQTVVVVQGGSEAALTLLEEVMPTFLPLGATSLADYESAATKLRAVASGQDADWPLIVSPVFAQKG